MLSPLTIPESDLRFGCKSERSEAVEGTLNAEPPCANASGADNARNGDDDETIKIQITITQERSDDDENDKGCGCTLAIIILVIATILAIFN